MSKWQHTSLNVKLVNYKGQKKKYGHLPVKDVEAHPWQTLCVDLIGPYTVRTKNGTQSLHAMTMFDPATSWFEVVEIPNKRAVTWANLLENTWLYRYPRPLQCIFDNGSESFGQSSQTLWTHMESNVFLQQ
jgi:hypothetical protein